MNKYSVCWNTFAGTLLFYRREDFRSSGHFSSTAEKFFGTQETLIAQIGLYVLKNLQNLEKRPKKLQEKIFEKLFQTAEIAKFNPKQRQQYESSLKYYRDLKNSIDTAREEGREVHGGELQSVEEGPGQAAQEVGPALHEAHQDYLQRDEEHPRGGHEASDQSHDFQQQFGTSGAHAGR